MKISFQVTGFRSKSNERKTVGLVHVDLSDKIAYLIEEARGRINQTYSEEFDFVRVEPVIECKRQRTKSFLHDND